MELSLCPVNNRILRHQTNTKTDATTQPRRSSDRASARSSINTTRSPCTKTDPLFEAIWRRNQTELSRVLNQYHTDLTAVDEYGQTALHLAISRGSDEAVKLLVSYAGDDPDFLNAPDPHGRDALTRVSLRGNAPLVKVLVAAGARSMLFENETDDSSVNEDRYFVFTAKLLITASGDINKAFDLAVEKKHIESILWLSANGANVIPVLKQYFQKNSYTKRCYLIRENIITH